MEGNQMKMREALVAVQKKIEHLCGSFNVPNSLVAGRMEINGIINAALSEPPRQCDVGTPDEQGERCMAQFDQWRRKGDGKKLITAIMACAQTPYEAKEGGAA